MANDLSSVPRVPLEVVQLIRALNEIRNAIVEVTEELRKLNNDK